MRRNSGQGSGWLAGWLVGWLDTMWREAADWRLQLLRVGSDPAVGVRTRAINQSSLPAEQPAACCPLETTTTVICVGTVVFERSSSHAFEKRGRTH